ncbi:MAG: thioredoxin family protein [Mariniblastus sp.]|nr:thioredoxin family protein [Mariniblastus sp.]
MTKIVCRRTCLCLTIVSCLTLSLFPGCSWDWKLGFDLDRNKAEEEIFNLGDTPKPALEPGSIWTENYQQAMRDAKLSGKYVIADFTGSDWCRWCVRLEKEVFETAEFQAWSADHAILLKVDFPRKTPQPVRVKLQNKRLAEQYANQIKGYPTILVLDPEGNVVARTGYVKGGPVAWLDELESQLIVSLDERQGAAEVPGATEGPGATERR